MWHLCTDISWDQAFPSLFTTVVIVQIMDHKLDVIVLKNMQAAVRHTGHRPH